MNEKLPYTKSRKVPKVTEKLPDMIVKLLLNDSPDKKKVINIFIYFSQTSNFNYFLCCRFQLKSFVL